MDTQARLDALADAETLRRNGGLELSFMGFWIFKDNDSHVDTVIADASAAFMAVPGLRG